MTEEWIKVNLLELYTVKEDKTPAFFRKRDVVSFHTASQSAKNNYYSHMRAQEKTYREIPEYACILYIMYGSSVKEYWVAESMEELEQEVVSGTTSY